MKKTVAEMRKEIKETRKKIREVKKATKEINRQTLEIRRKREKLEANNMKKILPLLDSLNAAKEYLKKAEAPPRKDVIDGYNVIEKQLRQIIKSLDKKKEIFEEE